MKLNRDLMLLKLTTVQIILNRKCSILHLRIDYKMHNIV